MFCISAYPFYEIIYKPFDRLDCPNLICNLVGVDPPNAGANFAKCPIYNSVFVIPALAKMAEQNVNRR